MHQNTLHHINRLPNARPSAAPCIPMIQPTRAHRAGHTRQIVMKPVLRMMIPAQCPMDGQPDPDGLIPRRRSRH